MALIVCTECGNAVSGRAAACPKCGAPLSSAAKYVPEKSHWLRNTALVVAGLFVLFVVWGFTIASTPEGKERIKMRDAIAYCDKSTERLKQDPRMTPDAIGFAMDTCEKMRDDYRGKWNREP